MKASQFVKELQERIDQFGDAELIIVKDFDTAHRVLGVSNLSEPGIESRQLAVAVEFSQNIMSADYEINVR